MALYGGSSSFATNHKDVMGTVFKLQKKQGAKSHMLMLDLKCSARGAVKWPLRVI